MPFYSGVVPAEALGGYPSSPDSLRQLVHEFNRTELMVLASQLNLLSSSFYSSLSQADLIDLLAKEHLIDPKTHTRLINRIKKARGSEAAITRPGMLELIRAAAIYSSDQNRLDISSKPHMNLKLARALLQAFEVYNQREVDPFVIPYREDMTADEKEAFYRSMAFVVRSSYTLRSARNPLLSLGRGLALLNDEFFNKDSAHVERFEAATGLHLQEYFDCIASIQALSSRPNSKTLSGMYIFTLDQLAEANPALRPIFERYLALESQDAAELEAAYGTDADNSFYDKKPLRAKPILHIGDGKYIIMDEPMFADRASVGAFFHSIDSKQTRNSFGPFGEACERYSIRLIKDHNEYVQNQGTKEQFVPSPQIVETNTELTDALLVHQNKVALCEVKGVWISEELLAAKDPEAFWDAVKARYASERANAKGKVKRFGMFQLFHAIEGLVSQKLHVADQQIPITPGTEFFPVLLSHDLFMAAPFFAHCLAIEFVRKFGLEELPAAGHIRMEAHGVLVHTPIVMSLNDLERVHALKSPSAFCEYLAEFSKKFPDRLEEFNNFVAIKERTIEAREDDYLLAAAKTALDLARHRMLGAGTP